MEVRPLRSMLYVPANRPDLVQKVPRFGPDAVVIDLEDGTPESEKSQARDTAVRAAEGLLATGAGVSVWLRVNSVTSGRLEKDVATFRSGPFDGLVVPKVEAVRQVVAVESLLAGRLRSRAVIWGIETVAGVHRVDEILAASRCGRGVYFGAEDFIADLGGRRSVGSLETLYARTRVAMAVRIAGLFAIDQVVLGLTDDDAFIADAEAGLDLGYVGKCCIHPRQVALTHAVHTPAQEEVDRAARLLDCFERALAGGRAVARFEGRMIDAPNVAQARRVIERAAPGVPPTPAGAGRP
jgi:citrate lyase subunit beta/citryl-CoA lyase